MFKPVFKVYLVYSNAVKRCSLPFYLPIEGTQILGDWTIKHPFVPFQYFFSIMNRRALDKRRYLMIIFFISHRNHNVVTPHLNRLVKTVQISDHNICFYAELTKIIPNYHHILPLIWSSGQSCHLVPIPGLSHCLTSRNSKLSGVLSYIDSTLLILQRIAAVTLRLFSNKDQGPLIQNKHHF